MANVIAWADLRARLVAANLTWAGQPIPIAYPNTTFAAPVGTRPWLRVDLATGTGQPIELGGQLWQDEGAAMVDVIVRIGTGLDAVNAILDALKVCFRGPPYEPVIYSRLAGDPGGAGDDDGQYFVTSLRADWRLSTVTNPRMF